MYREIFFPFSSILERVVSLWQERQIGFTAKDFPKERKTRKAIEKIKDIYLLKVCYLILL